MVPLQPSTQDAPLRSCRDVKAPFSSLRQWLVQLRVIGSRLIEVAVAVGLMVGRFAQWPDMVPTLLGDDLRL